PAGAGPLRRAARSAAQPAGRRREEGRVLGLSRGPAVSPGAAGPGRLAFAASAGAAVVVPLAYFPGLDAPFLAPKFSALELVAALAFLAWVWRRGRGTAPVWSRPAAAGAALVLVTTLWAWAAAAHGPVGAPYAVAGVGRWLALFGVAAGAAL